MDKIFACERPLVSRKVMSAIILGLPVISLLPSPGSAATTVCDFKNGDVYRSICGYVEGENGSVPLGGTLNLHVSTDTPNFTAQIQRVGSDPSSAKTASFTDGVSYGVTDGSYANLGWSKINTITIPSTWKSGLYELNLSNTTPGSGGKEYFTVRAANPGSTSKILLLDNLTTVEAYDPIGGKSLYGFNSSNSTATTKVSINRPSGVGDWPEHIAFATWLDSNGIAYESASMLDLHNNPRLR
jgi:hypothetical protein